MRQTEKTWEEMRVWAAIRNRRCGGYRFRRQEIMGQYIVDFYCAEASLAIEVDGAIHGQTREADSLRQAYIEGLGLRFLRFTNDEILNDMERVLATIAEHVANSRSPR